MMRQIAQMIVESLDVKRLHRRRRPLMKHLAPLDQQRVIGDLLRQRMFEDVFYIVRGWVFVDELARLQVRQHLFQWRVRRGSNLPDQGKR